MIMSMAFLATGMKSKSALVPVILAALFLTDLVIDLGVGSHFWQETYADYNPGFLIVN